MTDAEPPEAESRTLKREAYEWVMRLTSGEATAADADALNQWRRTSQAHRRAFAEANLLWETLHPAVKHVAGRHVPAMPVSPGLLGRRAFLGGAAAASAAAAVGYLAVKPPLELWPSLSEMTADYRTGVGQQRQLALASNVSVELNTRTSIALLSPGAGEADTIELIAGEAAIATPRRSGRPFVVVAAHGRTTATGARFNVRHDDTTVHVTCLEGDVQVEHLGQATTVSARQQIAYTHQGLGPAAVADPEVATAWQRGLLVFRNDPLARVIDEVNRYRPGRIILTNAELGQRLVLATFRIDHIDEVVPRLQAVFDVHVRALPGGIVLVS